VRSAQTRLALAEAVLLAKLGKLLADRDHLTLAPGWPRHPWQRRWPTDSRRASRFARAHVHRL